MGIRSAAATAKAQLSLPGSHAPTPLPSSVSDPAAQQLVEVPPQASVLKARRRMSQLRSVMRGEDPGRAPDRAAPVCWTEARIALAQQVWGEGFIGPGGEELILSLVEPLRLKRRMRVLELGAGLGGAARVMARRRGARVTGMEWDDGLAKAGETLSDQGWLIRKAPVYLFGEAARQTPLMAFDRFLARDFLLTVRDKLRVLRPLAAVLRDHGELLLTDFVLAAPEQRAPQIEAWTAADPHGPVPWSATDYITALTGLGLHVRVDDVTERIGTVIRRSWAGYLAWVKQTGLESRFATVLASEAALWTRRAGLLESGALNVCRFHVARQL
jgi:SAM-dependent methyltransferase